MAIMSVSTPQRRQNTGLSDIADVLRIIQSGYGIKTDYEQGKVNALKLKEAESEARRKEGIFTPEQAGQEFRVTADSPYMSEAIPGRIERKNPDTNTIDYETFHYVPKERIEKLAVIQNIDEAKKKSLLEAEYRQGRISPRDLANPIAIRYEETPPVPNWAEKGWLKRWDIEPNTGKQVTRWVLPNAAGAYYGQQERAANEASKIDLKYKTEIADSLVKYVPALNAMKTLDKTVKSDDPNAPIPGADELIRVLNSSGGMKIISNGEVWRKPELMNKFIEGAGRDAQKLWQNINTYMNHVLLAMAGTAVSENEMNRQVTALGAHAFTTPENLKNGLNNAKSSLFDVIRSKEAGYYKDGRPSQILLDYRKAPGAVSSEDPFFKALKSYNSGQQKSRSEKYDELLK